MSIRLAPPDNPLLRERFIQRLAVSGITIGERTEISDAEADTMVCTTRGNTTTLRALAAEKGEASVLDGLEVAVLVGPGFFGGCPLFPASVASAVPSAVRRVAAVERRFETLLDVETPDAINLFFTSLLECVDEVRALFRSGALASSRASELAELEAQMAGLAALFRRAGPMSFTVETGVDVPAAAEALAYLRERCATMSATPPIERRIVVEELEDLLMNTYRVIF